MTEGKSAQLACMNHPRVESASCVYNNDVIVTGGYDGRVCIESIEILSMDQQPLQWRLFDGKLPASLSSHCVVIYKDKLITIGGMNSTENKTSNAIHETSLFPPYTSKRIFKMNQARRNHSAELVDDLLFVLGGTHTGLSADSTNTVMSYDIAQKERKRCESLPYRVSGMSTVTWGNNIIVIGGADKNDRVLNSVIMYETVSGNSKFLPSMLYNRYGSSAVIVDGIVYVMGGWNQELGYLSSIECLTIGNTFWVELPGMRERRRLASAVVKPLNQYV
ncbi:kelch-like protein 40b [Dendronephthya gigantea]|uniref:kelch-like protein 40b n=1 Tax=Dendronephthya gigantea TaxID=151771 RepID=UPI00106B72CC|nr:kelch-like protein 40b [Dendronephthya gigantea]